MVRAHGYLRDRSRGFISNTGLPTGLEIIVFWDFYFGLKKMMLPNYLTTFQVILKSFVINWRIWHKSVITFHVTSGRPAASPASSVFSIRIHQPISPSKGDHKTDDTVEEDPLDGLKKL